MINHYSSNEIFMISVLVLFAIMFISRLMLRRRSTPDLDLESLNYRSIEILDEKYKLLYNSKENYVTNEGRVLAINDGNIGYPYNVDYSDISEEEIEKEIEIYKSKTKEFTREKRCKKVLVILVFTFALWFMRSFI